MTLSALSFDRQFTNFKTQVLERSGASFVSFDEGLPAQWEDYKEAVRGEALGRLGFATWRQSDVGKGQILKKVIHAIEIDDRKQKIRNNLVAWTNKFGHIKLPHRALLDAKSDKPVCENFERVLFEFFHDRIADADAFEALRDLAGKRYDLLAYLFFLKDWTRFMPIAPNTFDRAFKLFGIDLKTAQQCSWANYSQFNRALMEIQRGLQDIANVAGARLIDAHSFCWMLVKLKLPVAPSLPEIPLPEEIGMNESKGQPKKASTDKDFAVVTEEQFIQRDEDKRRLGNLAQDIALKSEQRRLREAGHRDVEAAVRPVWDEPGRGYDILSTEIDGSPRHIEVKSARQSSQTLSFFLTRNEWHTSQSLDNYRFYLVLGADSSAPRVMMLNGRDLSAKSMEPVNYLARVSA